MNALLIYPEFPDTFWSFKHALKFIRKKAALPPLGLITIASLLPRAWNVRLIDTNVTELTDELIEWAELVLISAMAIQRPSAYQVIERCKKQHCTVIAGGPLFTAEHEAFPQVDHFILNEAEITWPLFLQDWERGCAQRCYSTGAFADMHTTPIPQWELLDLNKYASMSIQYSRGCPYNCDFCNVTTLLGHRPRVKSTAQVLAELDGLYAAGWRRNVFFVDDNFIGNKKALKTDLLPALIRWQQGKRGIGFYTEASINLADDQRLMDQMREAGFNTVFVGIETPAEEALVECNKKHNVGRDLMADVKKLTRNGLQVQGGFILGFDSDTPSIFQRQIDFIQKSGVVTAMVGLLEALQGTQLWERLHQEGRLRSVSSGDNADGLTNIIPTMDIDTLRQGYKKVMNHLYAPRPYYARIKTFLRDYRPPKIRPRVDGQHFLALFRAAWHLGVKGPERVQYWKLLTWTLMRRPKLFPLAVELAINGFHLRTMSQLHLGQ